MSIDLEQLAAIIEQLDKTEFTDFRYENGDLKIRVSRGGVIDDQPTNTTPAAPAPVAEPASPAPAPQQAPTPAAAPAPAAPAPLPFRCHCFPAGYAV